MRRFDHVVSSSLSLSMSVHTQVWFDRDQLRFGNGRAQLEQGVRRSEVYVLVVSPTTFRPGATADDWERDPIFWEVRCVACTTGGPTHTLTIYRTRKGTAGSYRNLDLSTRRYWPLQYVSQAQLGIPYSSSRRGSPP